MALCLSGGGFRALHWHLGSLRVLNTRGLLPRLRAISGVSAGALTAAWLGLRWARLDFDAQGRARRLDSEVLEPLSGLAQRRIGLLASGLSLLQQPGLSAGLLQRELDSLLFRGAELGGLVSPQRGPLILLCALDLDHASPLHFEQAGLAHPLHGRLELPELRLAAAATASCAFPPFFAPCLLRLPAAAFSPGWSGGELLRLADGVVHDNLGLDALWDSAATLLVSDASLPDKQPSPIRSGWYSVLLHSQRSLFHHSRLARLARLREQFTHGLRQGAYWGLSGEWFSSGGAGSACADELAAEGRVAANLLRLPEPLQRLLEHGSETLADAALDSLVQD